MLIQNRQRSVFYFMTFLLSLALSSCNAVRNSGVGRNIDTTPKGNLWASLYNYGEEEDGFATYTYVLVGRDGSHRPTRDRYWTLINAITSSTTESDFLRNKALKRYYNLFLIPSVRERSDSGATFPAEKLSMELLTELAIAAPGKFENPGPYLITLHKPIKYGGTEEIADILFLDLSNTPIEGIKEYIRAYKERIVHKKVTGIEKLEILRMNMLATAFTMEDSIGFAFIIFDRLQKHFAFNLPPNKEQ